MDQVLERYCLPLPSPAPPRPACTLACPLHWRGPCQWSHVRSVRTPAGSGTVGPDRARAETAPLTSLHHCLASKRAVSMREVDTGREERRLKEWRGYDEWWSGATVSLLEHPKLYYAILYYRGLARLLSAVDPKWGKLTALLDSSKGRESRRGRTTAVTARRGEEPNAFGMWEVVHSLFFWFYFCSFCFSSTVEFQKQGRCGIN